MTDSQLVVSVRSGSGWEQGSVIRLTLPFEPFLGRQEAAYTTYLEILQEVALAFK